MSEIVLITGGAGSFGETMLHRILDTDIDQVCVFSLDEEKQDAMRHTTRDDHGRDYIGVVRGRVLHAKRCVGRFMRVTAIGSRWSKARP